MPAERRSTWWVTVFGSHPTSCAAEWAQRVRSNASRIIHDLPVIFGHGHLRWNWFVGRNQRANPPGWSNWWTVMGICCPPAGNSRVRQRGFPCPPTGSMSCPLSHGEGTLLHRKSALGAGHDLRRGPIPNPDRNPATCARYSAQPGNQSHPPCGKPRRQHRSGNPSARPRARKNARSPWHPPSTLEMTVPSQRGGAANDTKRSSVIDSTA